MSKGKYYVSKVTGEIWYVQETTLYNRTGLAVVHLWNCNTKEAKSVFGTPKEYDEYFLEITREQAFDSDFQKWMKLCYGRKSD